MKNKDEVESFFHTKIANHLFENGTKYVRMLFLKDVICSDNMKLKIIMLRISSTKLTFLISSHR